MTTTEKALLQRAADLKGESLTEFVIRSAKEAADRVVEEATIWRLSAEDSRLFVETLLNPPEPNATLRAAAAHYKKVMGR